VCAFEFRGFAVRPAAAGFALAGAFLASVFTPGNSASPVGRLFSHASPWHLTAAAAAEGSLGPSHPRIPLVVPTDLVAPAAERLVLADPIPGPRCDDTQPRGRQSGYNGRSVSLVYDGLFGPWAAMPYLDSYIPQALTTWENWESTGHDLVLLGMYRDGNYPSYLVGIDPESGRVLGTVTVKQSHLGAMGFLHDWLFSQDNQPLGPHDPVHLPTVRRYRIEALRAAMQQAIATGRRPYLQAEGDPQRIDAIDFLAVADDSIFAGNHGWPTHGRMYRYQVGDDGVLRSVEGPWTVPGKAQGLVITPHDFVFASDQESGRGQLTVVRRAAPDKIGEPVSCVWMPSMPEGLTIDHGMLIAAFESGSPSFWRDHPLNRIGHLHSGPLDGLLLLGDSVAAAAEGLVAPGEQPAPAGVSDARELHARQ